MFNKDMFVNCQDEREDFTFIRVTNIVFCQSEMVCLLIKCIKIRNAKILDIFLHYFNYSLLLLVMIE